MHQALKGLLVLFIGSIIPTSVFAEHTQLPEMDVYGQSRGLDQYSIGPGVMPAGAPDAASFMKRVPGGAVNDNGPISGQVQYRGMFGPRMNVSLDGTYLESGGPNWMDPPLHYAPQSLLESLNLTRGISSVSTGTGIGGYLEATTKSSHFTDSPAFGIQGDVNAGGSSVDEGYSLGGVIGVANNQHRFHIVGSHEQADDMDFGNGRVGGTEFDRSNYGLGYGFRQGQNEFSLDYRHTDTDGAGTPALPLDITFFDTDRYSGKYSGQWNSFGFDVAIYHTDIEHQMNNYRLRPAPDFSNLPLPPFLGTDRRFVNADSADTGYSFKVNYAIGSGQITFGSDGHFAEHNATVFDPDFKPFFVTNFNNARYDTYGLFGEWKGSITPKISTELGIRYQHVETDADQIDAFPARLADMGNTMPPPQAVRALRNRFNAADRKQTDDNIDAVAKLNYQLNAEMKFELGFARKVRSPSYIERYLWIPLEVNAGLGDGNNYVGNINLKPEKSHQIELGFEWRTNRYFISPRGYYRRIDDYIQGVPVEMNAFNMPVIGVSANANGDPTPLQFANVDAEIYGFDMDFGASLTDFWRVDGTISYVRGKRRDINDNLFRISPPNLRLSMTHQRENWYATLEGVFVDRQDHISQTITFDPANPKNTNAETPGYILINLFGQADISDSLSLSFGINNLLDKTYTDHLSGFNRNTNSDVPVGVRLPGAGRNVFARLALTF